MRGLHTLFALAFFLWGGGFGMLAFVEFLRAATAQPIGVGTSAAVSMTLLAWIGGMGFFGGGALLMRPWPASAGAEIPMNKKSAPASDWPVDPTSPRVGDHSNAGVSERASFRSVEYCLHGDGVMTARINGQQMSWRNQAGFKAWAEGGAK